MTLALIILPMTVLVVYGLAVEVGHPALQRWFDIREREGPKAPRIRSAAEIDRFIEQHPKLSTLKLEQARTVAAVLVDELDRRSRVERRFQLVIAIASVAGGYILARV